MKKEAPEHLFAFATYWRLAEYNIRKPTDINSPREKKNNQVRINEIRNGEKEADQTTTQNFTQLKGKGKAKVRREEDSMRVRDSFLAVESEGMKVNGDLKMRD